MSVPAGAGEPRVAVVGVSTSQPCGVRDHAVLLSRGLAAEGLACSDHWLLRAGGSLREEHAAFAAWSEQLAAQLRSEKPDVVLLHYSVFSFAHRGVPVFTHRALAPIRSASLPLVAMLHEYAYPWGRGGPRGAVWAITQRAALLDVMRASAAVVVTAPFRAQWLAGRFWLPRRDLAVAPVFSNLPTASPRATVGHEPLVGLFGYAYEGAEMGLVLDAVRELRASEPALRLQLLGGPGSATAAGRAWLDAARARGIEDALGFSGVLPAQQLADEIARCDVLLHPEPSGPTSRKTTLAGSLASGRPVLALEGPRAWRELIDADAAVLAAPRASALADAIVSLLGDPQRADALGARGREFAERRMSVEGAARAVRTALEAAIPRPAARSLGGPAPVQHL